MEGFPDKPKSTSVPNVILPIGTENGGSEPPHGSCPRRGSRKAETSQGYALVLARNHPRAMQNGYVLESVLIAEAALGKPLPPKVEVHHVNGIKNDNARGNHVVCEDRGYHMLLHQRTRALKTCGHANWIRCAYCKQYDDPTEMYVRKNVSQGWHRKCHANRERRRKDERRKK
mgnify:CR=1 FL=1